ncbi:hypothetical protein D9V32_12600 [Mycetocola tolaasinivorans]|uniref:ABC transporter permease n=1 Tax=Mycetocola tolaasinivorans TaxID=76635 RepID=A0A3L7A3A0_9MICO|nr:hypothetical protein D9V32_12600 [Mycetocola tolaasinivorans]
MLSLHARGRAALSISVLVFFLAMTTLIVEGHSLGALKAQLSTFEEAGGNVLVVDAEGASIPQQPCSTLSDVRGVIRAGAMVGVATVHSSIEPSISFRQGTVSAEYLMILSPDWDATPGAVLGPEASDTVGLAPGSELRLGESETDTRFGSALPASPRAADRARWIYNVRVVSDEDAIRECWVQANSGYLNQVREAAAAAFSGTDALRIRSLVDPGSAQSAIAGYDSRLTGWLWLVVGPIIGGVILTHLRARASEYALYRVSGFAAQDVALISYLEIIILVLLPSLIAASAAAMFFAGRGTLDADVFAVVSTTTLKIVGSGIVVAVALGFGLVLSSDLGRTMKGRG